MTVVLEKEERQVWPAVVMEERPVWPSVQGKSGVRLRRRDGGRTQEECRAIGRAMEQKCMRELRQAAIHAAFWQGGRVAETAAERYLQTCAHRGWNGSGRGVDTGTLMAEQRRQEAGYLTPWGGWVSGRWVMGRAHAERAFHWLVDFDADALAEVASLREVLRMHFEGREMELTEQIAREVVRQFPPLSGGGYVVTYEVGGKQEECELLNGSVIGPCELEPSQELQVLQAVCHRLELLPFEMVLHIDARSALCCDELDTRRRTVRRFVEAGRATVERLIHKWSGWYDAGAYTVQIERRWGKSLARIDDQNLAWELFSLMEGVGAHTAAAWRLQRRSVWADGLAAVEAEAAAYLADPGRPIDVPTRGELMAYAAKLQQAKG